jgi:hypothetical protein
MKQDSEPSSEGKESNEELALEEEAEGGDAAAAGEGEELASGEENVNTIEGLLKLDDVQLMSILGMSRQLQQVKEDLKEAAALKGEARKIAEEKIERLLTPQISESSFRWAVDDAKREAARKSGKKNGSGGEAYADTSPGSVV